MSESFAELFEQSLTELNLKHGAIVTGTVVDIDGDWVTIYAGLKSEGVISRDQFLNDQGELEIKVGDEVNVALEAIEDGFGETKLSREKAKRVEAWNFLENASETDTIVRGVISGRVKGGFTVEIAGIRAFLPGSLVDTRPLRDTSHLEGQELDFKVIKLDQKRNNIVVSRRGVMEEENSAERDALLETLAEGQILKGTIKNLTDYGAFVDLGGVDGLLHITDMAWRRVKHPSEIVSVGDEIEVIILKYDKENSRVSLGAKQLGNDPWLSLKIRYPEGTQHRARVTNLTDYGCFAEIEEGIEGLVHVSEMDWTNKNIHPTKVVQVGDEVNVMILSIDEERRRISLGIKQCMVNPWEEFARKHNKGEKITGAIRSITDFGIFIGLEGGIDGLVHLSDISWNEDGEDAIRRFKKGDELTTLILGIDVERERISLSIKQLEGDPFTAFASKYERNSIVTGVVKEVEAKEAIVTLDGDIDAVLKIADISRDRTEDARDALKVGDTVEAKITVLDRKNRNVVISIKAKDLDDEKKAVAKLRKETNDSPATLGDLIRAKMEQQN